MHNLLNKINKFAQIFFISMFNNTFKRIFVTISQTTQETFHTEHNNNKILFVYDNIGFLGLRIAIAYDGRLNQWKYSFIIRNQILFISCNCITTSSSIFIPSFGLPMNNCLANFCNSPSCMANNLSKGACSIFDYFWRYFIYNLC